jgi:hypothetical protein
MPSGFKSIKEVFRREKSFKDLRELVDASDVVVKFNKIFPDLDKVVNPISCEKGILKIKVENPAWRNELKFRETELIEKINNFYKETRINKIRFFG